MILLTGATGFLGKELLGRLLLSDPNCQLALLIRSSAAESADSRAHSLLRGIFGESSWQSYLPRVNVVAGDASLENFGLGQSAFDQLACSVETVYHCAASTQLNLPLAEAHAINCGGTEQIVKLLLKRLQVSGQRPELFHVSTAYVAGNTKGEVLPTTIGSSFRNSYEQTKAEAEKLVLANESNIKSCIFRPSIIVGDSITGQTSAFNVLYMPARMLISGVCKALPASPHTPFDVVPVDYVSDAILSLSRNPNRQKKAYHITVGIGRESCPHEILIYLLEAFSKYHSAANTYFISPSRKACEAISKAWHSNGAFRQSVESLEKILGTKLQGIVNQVLPFVPYMLENPRFNTFDTELEFPQPPLFESYAKTIFSYCLETNWGKTPWDNPKNLSNWICRGDYQLAL